jgi:hypothetical protein
VSMVQCLLGSDGLNNYDRTPRGLPCYHRTSLAFAAGDLNPFAPDDLGSYKRAD